MYICIIDLSDLLNFDDDDDVDGSVDFFSTPRTPLIDPSFPPPPPSSTFDPFKDNNQLLLSTTGKDNHNHSNSNHSNADDPFADYSIEASTQTTTEITFGMDPLFNSTDHFTVHSNNGNDDDDEKSDYLRERIELKQRRLAFIRLFLRADVVYSSPLTRAVQTALMALHGHQAFVKNNIGFYRLYIKSTCCYILIDYR